MQPNIKYNLLFPALFQEALEGEKIHCTLCPHNCILNEGSTGICRTRTNKKGVLYTLSYGNLCSVSVDPIEKKPLFHFFPKSRIFSIATQGCNLRCLNCQNWTISQEGPSLDKTHKTTPEEVVKAAISQGTDSIAFTYTEPTVFYEYMLDIAKVAKQKGLRCVIISNGYINQKPLEELCPYIDGANIDLKCFDEDTYHKLTGGSLQPVLQTLETLKKAGIWLEITNLMIPGWNDDPTVVSQMCQWLVMKGFKDTPIHFSRFFPNYQLQLLPPTPENILKKATKRAKEAGMKYVYTGNLFFGGQEDTLCPKCGKLLIERTRYNVGRVEITIKSDGSGFCPDCGEKVPGIWA